MENKTVIITNLGQQEFHYTVRVAQTQEEKKKGLMGCSHLELGEGMLFLLGAPQTVTLWMKDVLIPIDMICIGEDHIIFDIFENRQPKDETVLRPSQSVFALLEINALECQKNNIQIGQKVSWT